MLCIRSHCASAPALSTNQCIVTALIGGGGGGGSSFPSPSGSRTTLKYDVWLPDDGGHWEIPMRALHPSQPTENTHHFQFPSSLPTGGPTLSRRASGVVILSLAGHGLHLPSSCVLFFFPPVFEMTTSSGPASDETPAAIRIRWQFWSPCWGTGRCVNAAVVWGVCWARSSSCFGRRRRGMRVTA